MENAQFAAGFQGQICFLVSSGKADGWWWGQDVQEPPSSSDRLLKLIRELVWQSFWSDQVRQWDFPGFKEMFHLSDQYLIDSRSAESDAGAFDTMSNGGSVRHNVELFAKRKRGFSRASSHFWEMPRVEWLGWNPNWWSEVRLFEQERLDISSYDGFHDCLQLKVRSLVYSWYNVFAPFL